MKINDQCVPLNLFWIFMKVRFTWQCAATTTTPTPTTTLNPCATCTINTITLTPGDGTVTVTPTTPGVMADANGCSVLTVTCTARPGGQTFMQFNVNQGGPVQPVGTVVTAQLNCINGQWNYAPGMGLPSRIITEVNCVNAGAGKK